MRVLPLSAKALTATIGSIVLSTSMLLAPSLVTVAHATGSTTYPSTLLTFETGDNGAAAMGSNDFGGAISSVSSTPPAGGSAGSTKSAEIAIHAGDASYAGVLFASLSGTAGFTSDANKIVTMNFYSPVAGVKVHLKLQVGTDQTKSVEMDAATNTVVGWQTLTFNFANVNTAVYSAYNPAYTYSTAYIFPDFSGSGASKTTTENFYFDDVAFNGAVTPALTSAGSGSGSGSGSSVLPASRIQATGLLGLVNNDSADAGWAQYYATGLHYYQGFVTKGSTFTLHFHVTDATGASAANQAVTLLADKSYATNTATFTSGATHIADAGSSDGADIAGTTDSSGNVSFTLTDTSSSGEASSTSTTAVDATAPGTFGQFALQIGTLASASAESLDIVDIHVISAAGSGSGSGSSSGTGLLTSRIVTPSTGVNGLVDKTSAAAGFTQYYGTALGFNDAFITKGSTFTLKWHVTDATGAALANQAVTLLADKSYAGNTATFTSGSTHIADAGGVDGAQIAGTTDSSGNVSFTLTDTSSNGEPSTTSTSVVDPLDGQTGSIFGQFALLIGSTAQLNSSLDIVDVHVIAASGSGSGSGGSSVLPATRLIVGSSTGILGSFDNSSTDGSWAQYYGAGLKYYNDYVYQGSTLRLTWHVTNSSGAAAANTPVTFVLNKGYSGSTASWSSASGNAGPVSSFTASDGVDISGTTDSSGNVTFIFQDASATAEPSTTPTNAADPLDGLAGDVHGQVTLLIGGVGQIATALDIVDLHVLALPALPSAPGVTPTSAPAFVPPTTNTSPTGTIGGAPTSTTFTPNMGASNVLVAVGGITITASGTTETGTTEPLASDSSLQVVSTGATDISAGGYQPNSLVSVYVHSTLTYLGQFPTDSTGHLTASFQIPASLAAGGHTLQIVGLTAGGATASLAIPVTVVATAAQVHAAATAASNAAALALYYETRTPPVVAVNGARATITADLSAKTLTCNVPAFTGTPTMAAYYLFVNRHIVSGERIGSFISAPLYPAVDAVLGGANLNYATWAIASSWNTGHIAQISCSVEVGNSSGIVVSSSATQVLPRVGKYVAVSAKARSAAPSAVTMRLVSPVMTRDAGGKPVDFVDESSSPVQDHWAQYYGNANGGLGVFYKYITAGSTTTVKYHVTDSKTNAPLPYFNVWLVVNKNYGGVENATFSYLKNGLIYSIPGHSTDLGETQIPGITDANGDVTFTLVNTNDPSSAEPKPVALNKVQPSSVTNSVFSTITLMAHLSPTSETKETKDFIWAHIVKP